MLFWGLELVQKSNVYMSNWVISENIMGLLCWDLCFASTQCTPNLIFLHQIKKWTDRHNLLSVNLCFTRKSFSPGFTLTETQFPLLRCFI